MRKSNRTVAKFLLSGLLILEVLLVGSCDSWMSNDDFMTDIESEVHDANAAPINVYVRYANNKMGTTEPQGSTTMKVDVASKLTAVTNDDYGFVRWAAFSTNDFSPEKQHSKLTFITEENYNENFKSKELQESVVQFSEPTNPVTEVKILQARDDIFIIPIVASRPAYVQSVPGAGDSSIVKNTSIRILFSKPIDESTILDDEGNLNFSITSSAAVFTDDDSEIEANDITDFFEYKFSDSKKMLTLKLKGDKLLDNRQYITVTLLEGLKDTYGYQMNGNYTFKFTTGTSTDSLAPMIEVIYGGTDDICNLFVTFGEDGQMKGTATNEAKNAPSDIASEKYTEQVVAQRIYDKLNIFVKANDIINSGNADINPAKDLSEDNVALIYIAAGLYINADGSPADFKNTSIAKKNYNYISGTIDPNSQIKQQFTDVVPLDKDGNKYNGGTIYTYDVSSLPDGLIRIDVWAGDMTGNAGGPDDKGAPYIEKHDNGYKSIFVVKDTTPIDSAEVKAQKKVISNSASAPYYWYNLNTLNTMELFDSPENKIQDAGHPKLRALDKNLWWTFKVGNVTESISKDDSTWKRIHDETDGTTSLHYNLANATAPSVDGPVDITLYLKDDMGNMSAPVLLDSIMYDNTAPSVSLKSGKGDFVNESGNEELHASNPKVIEQILKVTIGEANENNNGSGIRRMEIHVKKGNEEVEAPLDAATFKVLYAPSSIENPTPVSEGIRQISVQTAEADSATTNTTKVFNVTDADKITDGTLFIYGLTLGDTDGTYEVNVDLFDSALNKTPVTAVTRIARDTTEPVINKVQVLGAQARKAYGRDEETWWLPYNQFADPNNLTKVTLKVSANESGSGLKYIKLADNAEFTEDTILSVGETALTRDVDYTLDTATRTIELKDWYTPLLINPTNGEHIITLENIKLNNLNAPAGTTQGNKILLTLDDFVDQSKSNENQIYYGDTAATGTLVYADSIAPQIAYLHIADSAKHTANNPDDKGYNGDNYTDSQNVVLTLTFGDTEAGNKGSGVNQVILSDNAEFTSGTQIYYRNEDGTETLLAQSTDYEITSDTVTFRKVFTETDTLKFTNVKLVSDVQGQQSIKADVQDFAGIKSVESKPANVIIYDSVNPELYEAYWVADNNTVTAGTCNSEVINNQTLRIEFTEVTSGVKVIQLDITQDGIANDTPYASPFDSISQLTYEYNGTENLVKDVDYTVQGKYIVLNKTYTSGAFNIKGITLKNTVDQASYNVNITLLDASENKHAKATGIAIDTIAPEFTESLRVPALKRTVELTANGTAATVDGYWLDAEHVNGSNKAADSIPVYIKIREKSSGIKVITFAANAVISEATTLWLVDGATKTEVDHSIYTIDTTANTITINNEADARALFRKSDDSVFELLVKNVGLNQPDTETSASNNTIKMFLSDVAKNQNPDGMVQATPSIYSDSRAPNAPTNLKLKDRKTTESTIAASDGYTNDPVIDMTFNLDASEQFGSGYHKFVLSGAKFIMNGENATTLKLLDSTGTAVPNVAFEISQDKTTLTLKRTNQTAGTYTVVRQAVSVELKNVELAKPTANENHTVSVTAYDLTGRTAEAVSTSIILDTQVPTVAPVFTAAFSKEGSTYDASLNVYPHPNGENGTGVTRTFGDKSIPTFYTKAKVDENDSSYNAVLGIHASDNICLGGNVRPTTFLYYVNDESFNMTLAQIITSNTKVNPETGINGNRANQTCLWFKFPVGKYSAVIADEAGNISSVFRFNVEADDTVPAVTDFADHVLFEQPNDGAKVYRNAIPATTASGEFTYTSNESIGKLFKSRKYVTKKSGDKYRIVLNLGGAYTSNNSSAIVKKLDGSDAADALNYAELSAAENRAPIEKYAIVTTYSDWAASAQDSSNYVPVTPGLTDALWHNYTTGSTPITDANSITSWIDSNKNLVIELPNTQSTAPVTVFVRDGCGNYSSVLLGYDTTSNTAVSYIVDGKLGKLTTNITTGSIDVPGIVQNPYLTVSTATSDIYTWAGKTYKWNNQSGNADTTGSNKGGVGQTRGFIRDFVKKATYYNPTLVSTDPFKIGLVLRVDETNQETVLFGETGNTTDTENYTARAMIYCTVDEGVPTRQTFMDAASSQTAGIRGYKSGWVNVKAKQNEDNKIVILLDYPTPDYSTLGWTTNDTNGEPKPYFIWYLFEDRVGNYEIAKVVNSDNSGSDLNKAYSADSSVFDRWLYDNEKPTLSLRADSTKSPSDIANTPDQVKMLIPDNNYSVSYLKPGAYEGSYTNTVYIYGGNRGGRNSGNQTNTDKGSGTNHKCSHDPDSQYWPFVDIAVSENTGIRAFAWTTTESYPSLSTISTSDSEWIQNTAAYWMSGTQSLTDDIGNSVTYKGLSTNAYFDYSDSNSAYKGKYSGTKVNTVIPYAKLSTDTDTTLYLHVMDWTGNINTYRIGSSICLRKDSSAPSANFAAENIQNQVKSSANEYYARTINNGAKIEVRIAGKGAGSAGNHKDIKVRLPNVYFSDSGSGYKGLSFTNYDSTTVNSDSEGPYLLLEYNTYKDFSTNGTNKKVYFFDNVGNYTSQDVSFVYDTDAPQIDTVSLITKENSDTLFVDEEQPWGNGICRNSVPGYGYLWNYAAKNTIWHNNISEIGSNELREIYLTKSGNTKFHVNLNKVDSENKTINDDISEVFINKWDSESGTWKKVTSSSLRWDNTKAEWVTLTENDTKEWSLTDTVEQYNYCMGLTADTGYDKIVYSNDGAYYQVVAQDVSGNASCQYFKLYLDNQAPTFTVQPTITITKGSINKDSNNVGRFFANSDKPMTINFTLDDGTGVGSKYANSKIKYEYRYLKGATYTDWQQMGNSNSATITIDDTAAIQYQNIEVRDMFGQYTSANLNTTHPKFKYVGTGDNDPMYFDKVMNYTSSVAKPTYIIGGTNATIKTSGKMSPNNNDYVSTYTKLLNQSENTVLITSKNQKKLKISFAKPAYVIGYLVTDGNGNIIPDTDYKEETDEQNRKVYIQDKLGSYVAGSGVPNTALHAYSGVTTLKNEFVETLPLLLPSGTLNGEYGEVVRKYYAVDIVGNISAPLVITYSYSDPNKAKDITLIESLEDNDLDSEKEKDAITWMRNNVKFAKFSDTTTTDNNGKVKKNRFFNGDYIVLRCTLPSNSNTYSERPTKVELYDVWSGRYAGSVIRGSAEYSSSSDAFKIYPSTEHPSTVQSADGRYYYYIAFKISEFDNHDEYNGSVIYAKIYGKESAESDMKCLLTDEEVRWKFDNQGPTLNEERCCDSEGDIKYLKNYVIGSNINQNDNIPADELNLQNAKVKDNSGGSVQTTIAYKNGSKLYIPVNGGTGSNKSGNFSDNLSGLDEYKIVAYSDAQALATATTDDTGWKQGFTTWATWSYVGRYFFDMPEVTTPHTHLALFLKDKVGNVSKPYYLAYKGENDSERTKYWIVEKSPETATIKAIKSDGTLATPAYSESATSYDLDVAMTPGVIIKKIEAVNASVAGVKFTDDSGEWTTQPTYNSNSDNLNYGTFGEGDAYINLKSLKITLNNLSPTSYDGPQNVTLKINDQEIGGTIITIPTRKLTPTDVELKQVVVNDQGESTEQDLAKITERLETTTTPEKVVRIKLLNGATSERVDTISVSGAKIKTDSSNETEIAANSLTWTSTDTYKYTDLVLTNIEQDWTDEKSVKLTITPVRGIGQAETTFDKPVFTVGIKPLEDGDIIYTLPENFTNGAEKTITIETSEAPLSRIEKVFLLDGSSETDLSTGSTTTSHTYNIKIYKDWEPKKVSLKIKDSLEGNFLTKTIFETVDAINTNDIIVRGPEDYTPGTEDYEYEISIPGITLGESNISHEGDDGFSWESATGETTAKVKITAKRGWNAKTVTLKVKDFSVKTLAITAPTEAEITTGVTGPSEYSTTQKKYEYSISIPGITLAPTDVTYTGVSDSGFTFTPAEGTNPAKVTMAIERDWEEDKTITLKVNETEVRKLDVSKIDATEIVVDGPDSYSVGTTDYEYTITVPGYTLKEGDVTSAGADGFVFTTETSKAKLTVNQNWTTEKAILKVNGNTVKELTRIAKTLGAGDVQVPEVDANNITTLTFPTGATSANITGITTYIGDTEITEDDKKSVLTQDPCQIELKYIPEAGWSTIPIKIKLNNNDELVFTVKEINPKTLTSADVTIGAGVLDGENVKVTLDFPTGAGMDNVASVYASYTKDESTTEISASKGDNNTVIISGLPAAVWTKIPITLTINGNSELSKLVYEVPAKELTASMFTITDNSSNPLSWSPDSTTTWAGIIITPPDGVSLIGTTATVSSPTVTDTAELPTITYNNNNAFGIQVANVDGHNKAMPSDLEVTITVNVGGTTKDVKFTLNNLDGTGHPKAPGASNNNQRSIFGFRTKGNSYSTTSTSAGATSEAPKTRSVSLTSWVNDLFNNDSEAAVKTVKDEVKSSAKKSAKKSKKSAKTAKVEKAAAEALAETSAAPVNELAETVAATVSAVTEVVEEAAPAVDEVSASLEAEAAAPLSTDPALPDASEESPSASAAAIILAIAAFCAAAAALTIIALKKRAAKK